MFVPLWLLRIMMTTIDSVSYFYPTKELFCCPRNVNKISHMSSPNTDWAYNLPREINDNNKTWAYRPAACVDNFTLINEFDSSWSMTTRDTNLLHLRLPNFPKDQVYYQSSITRISILSRCRLCQKTRWGRMPGIFSVDNVLPHNKRVRTG